MSTIQPEMALLSSHNQSLSQPEMLRYCPLTKKLEIRLLQILPSEHVDDPISCVLSHAQLSDNPRYTALSYCWGDSYMKRMIYINGCKFWVTQNLELALEHIRVNERSQSVNEEVSSSFRDALLQLLWIDAVCINQYDMAEKAEQVALMRDIYASASNVISWLGSLDDETLSAFNFIRTVVDAAVASQSRTKTRRQQLEDGLSDGKSLIGTLTNVSTFADPRLMEILERSDSVIGFFSKAYWHRVWIVQEVVMTNSGGNIIMCENEKMLCSDVQVFRDSWLAFLKNLQANNEWEPILSSAYDLRGTTWRGYLRKMEETLITWSYYDFMRGLLANEDSLFFIILTTAYNATEPRDSVYGLLGIVNSSKLVPDYQKPVELVFREWFTTVLRDWKNYQPLYFSGLVGHSTHLTLPSWVPDLTAKITESPIWDATLSGSIQNPDMVDDFSFGETISPDFPRIYDDQILHAKLVWCDTVAYIHRIDGDDPAFSIVAFCALYLNSSSFIGKNESTIMKVRDIFQVLMCGINRFNPSNRTTSKSLNRRNFDLVKNTNVMQLTKTMPLFQAVAKLLVHKGSFQPDNVDDFVLDILCRPSVPLGSDISDVQLAAAFVTFLTTDDSLKNLLTSNFANFFGARTESPFLENFLLGFFPDRAAELAPQISYDIFFNESSNSLVESLKQYFKTFDQTIFITDQGYLGNGPGIMDIGDRIAVLDGAKMPFVMRADGRGHSMLVGPGYLDGWSNGEPAKLVREGKMSVSDILII